MDMKLDLNKVDKIFLISIITMFGTFIVPIILFLFSLFFIHYKIGNIFIGLLLISVILSILIFLISYLIQIITFFLKIFVRNKVKKDYIIVLLNFISILIAGYIILMGIGIFMLVDNTP